MELTIDSTTLSSLGFTLSQLGNLIGIGDPKSQGSGKDEYTSKNHFLGSFKQKSNEINVSMFGSFVSTSDRGCITASENALYTLYGILTTPGEHTFLLSDGTNSETFKGIMHRGATVKRYKQGYKIVLDITFKILKTND